MLEKCELSATFCRLEAVVDRSTRTAYTDGFTVLACLLPGYFPSNIIKDTIMFRYPPMHTHSRTHTCIRTRKHIYTHIYIHSLKPRHKSCSFTHTYYARMPIHHRRRIVYSCIRLKALALYTCYLAVLAYTFHSRLCQILLPLRAMSTHNSRTSKMFIVIALP